MSAHIDAFQAEAVRLALVKMFRPGGYFSICTVRKCLEIVRVEAPRSEMAALDALHCVSWSDMTQAMRAEVVRRTLALLKLPPADVDELRDSLMPDTPAKQVVGFLGRLIGKGADA